METVFREPERIIFRKPHVNMAVTTDESLLQFGEVFTKFVITKVVVSWESGAFNTACAGGIYSAASKGGNAYLAAAQTYNNLTGTGRCEIVTLADANLSYCKTHQLSIPAPGLLTNYIPWSLTTANSAALRSTVEVWGHAWNAN